MKNGLLGSLLLLVAIFSQITVAADHPELKAYPVAKEGMERLIIVLPHKERGDDEAFKVELIPGKTMQVDAVNRTWLGMFVVSKLLKGWGYSYYEIAGNDVNTMSTMMAAPENGSIVEKFVPGKALMLPYNSRLPIVVYVPKGVEIHYRIWSADATKPVLKG